MQAQGSITAPSIMAQDLAAAALHGQALAQRSASIGIAFLPFKNASPDQAGAWDAPGDIGAPKPQEKAPCVQDGTDSRTASLCDSPVSFYRMQVLPVQSVSDLSGDLLSNVIHALESNDRLDWSV